VFGRFAIYANVVGRTGALRSGALLNVEHMRFRLSGTGVILILMRSIETLLHFRSDLSPFLVHLTRSKDGASARENLESIVKNELLFPGIVSDARFAVPPREADDYDLLAASAFSETPLGEIHSLFEIASRQVNLEPYGLVFLKHKLSARSVSPVIYVNNEQGDKDAVIRALATLRRSHPKAAAQLLPLVAVFGKKLSPVGGTPSVGRVDFTWEREWRYAYANGAFEFVQADVFVELCPHEEIRYFERLYRPVSFVDPRRNVRWYAAKLVKARHRTGLKYSVV